METRDGRERLVVISNLLALALAISVFVGFASWSGRGDKIDRLQEQVADAQEQVVGIRREMDDLENTLDKCHKVVRAGQRFAKSAVRSHMDLYERARDWAADGFFLGVRGDLDEAELGLDRMIYELSQQYSGLYAQDIGSNEWLGWTGETRGLVGGENLGMICLGISGQ